MRTGEPSRFCGVTCYAEMYSKCMPYLLKPSHRRAKRMYRCVTRASARHVGLVRGGKCDGTRVTSKPFP
eukprot:10321965-Ditylum_brightwellii.AAC.1